MVEEKGGAATATVATSDAVGSALLRCYTEALRLNSAVDRLGRLEEENGMTPSAGNFGNIVTMFVRAKRLDSARQAKAMMEASGFACDGRVYGELIHEHARVRRLEEGIELLEEMAAATPPIQTADRYVKLLRAKCTRKGIESALIPADPNIFLRDVKKDLRSRGKRTARARQLNNF
jgi:hypothetical protein